MTNCGGVLCPINTGAAVCIQNLCLCENSLWYNSSRRCDGSAIRTVPLQRCIQNSECEPGISPLRETCIGNRCMAACSISPDCRHVNARCVSGICVCDYGLVMQARGCTGLEYIPPGIQGFAAGQPTAAQAGVPPTLGFWLYVAIIGGTLLGTAMVLIIVHTLLNTRPVHPDSFRRMTAFPQQDNPFAPTIVEPDFYDRPRRQTYITKLVEKRFNFDKEKENRDRRQLEEIIEKFNREHPSLAAKLDDQDEDLSPPADNSKRSSRCCDGRNSRQRSRTLSPINSISEDNSLTRSFDRPCSESRKKSVKWTKSTHDRLSTGSEDEDYSYRPRSRSRGRHSRYSDEDEEEERPRSSKYSGGRRGAAYMYDDHDYTSGLGRNGRRFSVVR